MSTVLEMADSLADECIAIQKEIGNDRMFMEVGQLIGASSQTLEEAFLTAVRTRMAEKQARDFLAEKLKTHRASAGGEG